MIRSVSPTSLPGVIRIERLVKEDLENPPQYHRGFYGEVYLEDEYVKNGITVRFVEDDASCSKKGSLRGLHGDAITWKLVTCLFGEIYLMVLNFDAESEHFGRWEAFELSAKNGLQILIPPKYGNGHLVMSDWAVFHYKQSEYYTGAKTQFVIRWNDPSFNMEWPMEPLFQSPRDISLWGDQRAN